MSMTPKEALKILTGAEIMVLNRFHDKFMEAASVALNSLKEKAERENPAPLTIEELRKIDGEPVWLTGFEWRVCYGTSTFRGTEYLETGMDTGIPLDGYGEKWFAYRHKPKEE